ncbi:MULTISPECIES: response regulator [unclassified Roseateles]|uniref:response regulator n=1 Tax=unclassified Roseateles TaxID=2626991 RepID=UPI0009E77D2F|nr:MULTISPECIES: response regulator [unclassified Roseateles]
MEFAELFAQGARLVLPLAWAKGLTSYFDYSGPSVELLVPDASLRAAIHRILLGMTDCFEAGFLMFTAEAAIPMGGKSLLVIRAAGTGTVSSGLDEVLQRLQLQPLSIATVDGRQRTVKARGVCPATGGRVLFTDARRDGLALSVHTHVAVAQLPDGAEHHARASDAAAWLVSPRPGRLDSVDRRLRRLGWQTRRFPSLEKASALLLSGALSSDVMPMMLVAAEIDGAELTLMEKVAAALPGVSVVLAVLAGSVTLKARERTPVDIRVLPLSPGELERFTLRVDRVLSNDEARQTSPSPFYAQVVKQVLVVDDNSVNQLLSRAQLEVLGYDVTVASDGEEAIKVCLESPPDAVLMDLDMPVLGGCDATRRLRDLQRLGLLAPFPIVASTSAQEAAAQQECFDAGMDGFLAKPIDLAVLAEELHRVVPMRPVPCPDVDPLGHT